VQPVRGFPDPLDGVPQLRAGGRRCHLQLEPLDRRPKLVRPLGGAHLLTQGLHRSFQALSPAELLLAEAPEPLQELLVLLDEALLALREAPSDGRGGLLNVGLEERP
jgi:hypothetical protein